MRTLRRILIVLVLLLVAVLLVGTGWWATHRDQARAWRQATVVGGTLANEGWSARIADALGTSVDDATQEAAGELPATLVTPADDGRAPAIVLLVPSGTSDVEERRIRDLQRAIAAADLNAWAVRMPGLAELLVQDDAPAVVRRILDDIAKHPRTRDRRVSVLALGPTAALVLRADGDGGSRADIRAIVAVAPIDMRRLVRDALTDPTFPVAARLEVGRVLVDAALREVGENARASIILRVAADAEDPIAALRSVPPRLAPADARPVLELLRTSTPEQFDAAWLRLPGDLRRVLGATAPLPVADVIDARVLVVVDSGGAVDTGTGDVDQLVETIGDARRIELDVDAPLEPSDVTALLDVSAWWLQRAGA